jgi:transcriptional regulator with XRE-family HTH domain
VNSQERIGKTLKTTRKSLGLKQSDVAEKVDISSNYYSMIERGEVESPGSQIMAKIAKLLKLKPEDVLPV